MSDRTTVQYWRQLAQSDIALNPPDPDFEHAVWMTADEVEAIEHLSTEYKKLVAENWPNK